MASTLPNSFVYLREINPALDQYKIKVLVVRFWRSFKSIEMVLVDGEGTRIHASIEEGLVKRFQHQFVNGESKIIDTFSFVDYDDVLGQIVDVWEVSIALKRKAKIQLPPGRENLIHVDCEVKTNTLQICFVEAMPKWYYIACKVCGKKVQPYPQGSHGNAGPIYSCGVRDSNVTNLIIGISSFCVLLMELRLRLKLLFFDGLAQRLIGKTAAELFAEVPESDPSILPKVLADLMGKNHEITVVSNTACDIIKPNIEMIESSTVDVSLSTDKRVFDDLKLKPDTGKKVFTRKKPKLEKLT
ncbi:putative nucleic acid-binding protein [Arabidopsis thaliana]